MVVIAANNLIHILTYSLEWSIILTIVKDGQGRGGLDRKTEVKGLVLH